MSSTNRARIEVITGHRRRRGSTSSSSSSGSAVTAACLPDEAAGAWPCCGRAWPGRVSLALAVAGTVPRVVIPAPPRVIAGLVNGLVS